MAGRVPFQSPAALYPPFLAPDLAVDPFNPDSIIFTFEVSEAGVVTLPSGQVVTVAESQLVIPPGAEGHIVYGTPIPVDVSRFASYDPAQFISAVGDIPFKGGAHGDIAVRGSGGWILLNAGTAGKILKTLGGGNNPAWQDA